MLGIVGVLGNLVLGLDAISWYQAALIPPTITSTTVFHYIEPETTATAPSTPAALAPSFKNPGLTPAEVSPILSGIRQMVTTPLNPAQTATVSRELQRPGQMLVRGGDAWRGVGAVEVDPGTGEMRIAFRDTANWPGGEIHLAKDGSVDFETGRSGEMFRAPLLVTPPPPVGSPSSAVRAGIAAGLGVLLAVYLFVIGVMMLCRQRPENRTRHIRYARLKLVLTVLGTAALGNMHGFFGPGMTATRNDIMLVGSYLAVALIVGASYPIALLIVLNRPPLKAWFANPGAEVRPAGTGTG